MELLIAELNLSTEYQDVIVENGDQPALMMLIAFGVTFGITRFITHSIRSERFSWLGNVEAGDTHIHHLVWGICLLLVAGLLAVAVQPPLGVTGIVFGIGAALTLDEFALWLHLEDVYWSEQGRQSVDAVIVFAVVTAFMVLGVYPISIGTEGGIEDILELLLAQAIGWAFCVICFLKGKLMWGVLGVYILPVAIYGALRLAKPTSWWAKRRYEEPKLIRSKRRYKALAAAHPPDPDADPAPRPTPAA